MSGHWVCSGASRWRNIDVLRHPALVALGDELSATVLEYADFAASEIGQWHERVLPYLRFLTARDELDELSHARLMIALAAGGRQAAALRTYEGLRQRLDEQLGVLPGPAVREAYADILRQEIPGPAGPGRPDAVHDHWRPVFQLPKPPGGLHRPGAGLREHHSCHHHGRQSHPGVPVVAISGLPGIRKTTLAPSWRTRSGISSRTASCGRAGWIVSSPAKPEREVPRRATARAGRGRIVIPAR
jgi:hypothetical protein